MSVADISMTVPDITVKYHLFVGRWEPDARGRLEQAAMQLFRERGFDDTTVADIAARAGLTERTFFRHYADKREVLFGGAGALEAFLVDHVDEAPRSLSPIDAVLRALVGSATEIFEERRVFARERQAIIAASPELQEREQVKLARLASAVADALRRRGVPGASASLAAETGMTIFKVAFERWTGVAASPPLSEVIGDCADDLRAMTATPKPSRS
jgi:AcrR family transcriptional regulator